MKQKDLLIFLLPAFLVVFFWVIFNIYHSSVTSTIPETISLQIIPISPVFDKKAIDDIKNRQEISPLYELSSQVSPSPQASRPASIQQITPTPSPTLQTSENQSSSGGQILP